MSTEVSEKRQGATVSYVAKSLHMNQMVAVDIVGKKAHCVDMGKTP